MARKKTSTTKVDADAADASPADKVEATAATSEEDVTDTGKDETGTDDTGKQSDEPQESAPQETDDSGGTKETDPPADLTGETDAAEPATAEPQPETPVEPDDAADPETAEAVAEGTDEVIETEPAPEIETTPETPPRPIVKQEVIERPISFIPLLLGGLLAGGVGFGAAFYGLGGDNAPDTAALENRIAADMQAQDERITALSGQIETLPPPADLSGVEAAQDRLSGAMDDLAGRMGSLEERIAAMDTRITELEKRPISEGASDAAVAAYERELQALQDAMATQRAEIEAMTAEAARSEENAEAIAEATMRRAAVSRIRTALDSGTGFADALEELSATGVAPPEALAALAAEGAPTLADLQDGFPPAARMALAAARQSTAAEGEGGGFGDFLRSQLGARSLEPREGDDPDAVLSRAEAALREARLEDALTEIDALPEAGRTALEDWAAEVTRRMGAIAAAERLGEELN